MPDLRAYVANCLIGGHTSSMNGNTWSCDTIELLCAGKSLILKQKANIVSGQPGDFNGKLTNTTEILVEDVRADEVEKALLIVDRICWLLSLAGLSPVVCYGHDYPDGSIRGSRRSVIGTANFFRPTLEIRDGSVVKAFIEQTYPNYLHLEKTRKLNIVIDYLLQAEHLGQPIESKLLFAFVILENLKDSYARSNSIPYIKGYFRKTESRKKKHKSNEKYKFEELLQLMFRAVRMRYGLKRIISLRNEIIHSGLSRKSHQQNQAMYERIHDLLREYLLRLLGYRGQYLLYRGRGNVVATI